MKKLAVALAAVASVAALAVGGVSANPDAGEVVAKGFACNVFDGDGNLFITYNSELRAYQTKAVLRCEGTGVPAAFLKHYNYSRTGLACGMLDFGTTTWWDDKVGRAGNSQLECTQPLPTDGAASSGGAGIG